MDYIAKLANASKRTVYNQGPSTETLFEAVILRFINEIMALKAIEYCPEKTIKEQLQAFAEVKLAITKKQTWLTIFKTTIGVLTTRPELVENSIAERGKSSDHLANWLTAADADGRLSIADANMASEIFYGMCSGTLLWPVLISGTFDTERENQLKNELVDMFIKQYS